METVVFELVESVSFNPRECHVCGGNTEKWLYLHAEVTSGPSRGGERLADHAEGLEEYARDLRYLAGCDLRAPADEEHRAANEAADAAYVKVEPARRRLCACDARIRNCPHCRSDAAERGIKGMVAPKPARQTWAPGPCEGPPVIIPQ